MVNDTHKEIVVAMDSFKGSLTSQQASEALAEGIRSRASHCRVTTIPLADGGEGSAEVLTEALGGSLVELEVTMPRGGRRKVRYGVAGEVAIVDFASAAGLTLLAPEERNPLLTTSRGVGEMVADALMRGYQRVMLCLGGSATNDCAVGALQALGYRFLDTEGCDVEGCGGSLGQIATIDATHAMPQLKNVTLELLTDVTTPLCGERGAARTFAPQKGATEEQVARLEEGVESFARVVESVCGWQMGDVEGGGAAGGAAAVLSALAGGRICRGADAILEAVGFRERIADASLVITGEGRIDHQTLLGKLPSRVAVVAHEVGVPIVAVGGSVAPCPELVESELFAAIYAATPDDMPLSEALQPAIARLNLFRIGEKLAEI